MERIGPYSVLGELARGGMGVVYRARDPAGGDVAIKVLAVAGAGGEQARRRFMREARALARLDHPGIVRVLQVDEQAGVPYLAMELVEGRTLEDRIEQQGPLPVEDALELARGLCAALAFAHGESILHRDLKPSNVLLDREDRPRLTDFGLAKDLLPSLSGTLSVDGTFMGTPGYWPPEQARGQLGAIGPASDVYGLGAVLFAALTGEPPHGPVESLVEAVQAVLRPPRPPSLLAPRVPAAVDAVVLRCLATDPADRYPTAQALGRALAPLRARAGGGRRGPLLTGAALLLVALLGMALAWAQPRGPSAARLAADADALARRVVLAPDDAAVETQVAALGSAVEAGQGELEPWRALLHSMLDGGAWLETLPEPVPPTPLRTALELARALELTGDPRTRQAGIDRLEAALATPAAAEEHPFWTRAFRFRANYMLTAAGRGGIHDLMLQAAEDVEAFPDEPVFRLHQVEALIGLAAIVPAERETALGEAEGVLGDLLRQHPDASRLLRERARLTEQRYKALRFAGDDDAAEPLLVGIEGDLRRAAALDPGGVQALRQLAALYERLGMMPRAADTWDALLARRDDSPLDWSHSVMTRRYAQRWEGLDARLAELVERFPDSADAWEAVTRCALTHHFYFRDPAWQERAQAAADRFRELAPDERAALGWQALVRWAVGEPDWDRELPAERDHGVSGLWVAQAVQLRQRELMPALEQGDQARAVELANLGLDVSRRAVEEGGFPLWALIASQMTWATMVTYGDRAGWGPMVDAQREMLAALPHEPCLRDRLALTLQLPALGQAREGVDPRRYLGDDPTPLRELLRQSIDEATHAIELLPTWASPYVMRGQGWLLLGEPQRAIEDLERGLELRPNDRVAQGLLLEARAR